LGEDEEITLANNIIKFTIAASEKVSTKDKDKQDGSKQKQQQKPKKDGKEDVDESQSITS
jgi:hypothetical protein